MPGDFTDKLTGPKTKAKTKINVSLGGLDFGSNETPLESLAIISRNIARAVKRPPGEINPFDAEPCASVVALAAAIEIRNLREEVEDLRSRLDRLEGDRVAAPAHVCAQDTARELSVHGTDDYFRRHGYYQAFRSGARIDGFELRVMGQTIGDEEFWRSYLYLYDGGAGKGSLIWDGGRTRDKNKAEHEGAVAAICFLDKRAPPPRSAHEDDVAATHAERQAAVDKLPPPNAAELAGGVPPTEGDA